jgi:hypothetical protein
MMARREFISTTAAGSAMAASGLASGRGGSVAMPETPKSGYALVNGLRLYSEIYGEEIRKTEGE